MVQPGSTPTVTFDEVVAARRDLLRALEALEPVDWDKTTLCHRWRVRDVVSHLALAPDMRGVRGIRSLLKARGDMDRLMDEAARVGGERTPDEILQHYRSRLDDPRLPMRTDLAALLTDTVVHSLDICHPNGWELHLPVERLRTVLDILVTLHGPFKGCERAEGLHFDTTDIDWRCGCGDHVRGPATVVLLALAGRPVCDQLTGDGVSDLAERA